jgi:diguanylate cyclase (GGDEF)-like protein
MSSALSPIGTIHEIKIYLVLLCPIVHHVGASQYAKQHNLLSVSLLDVDDFKKLNDTYGHAAGDVVLKSFASFLLESVRQTDLVCRYGGEEFAFVFPESTLDEALVLADDQYPVARVAHDAIWRPRQVAEAGA